MDVFLLIKQPKSSENPMKHRSKVLLSTVSASLSLIASAAAYEIDFSTYSEGDISTKSQDGVYWQQEFGDPFLVKAGTGFIQNVLLLEADGKPGAVKFEPAPSSEKNMGFAFDPDSSKVDYSILGGWEGSDASSGNSRFFLGGDRRGDNNIFVLYFDSNGYVRIGTASGVSKTLRVNGMESGAAAIEIADSGAAFTKVTGTVDFAAKTFTMQIDGNPIMDPANPGSAQIPFMDKRVRDLDVSIFKTGLKGDGFAYGAISVEPSD